MIRLGYNKEQYINDLGEPYCLSVNNTFLQIRNQVKWITRSDRHRFSKTNMLDAIRYTLFVSIVHKFFHKD